jgi:hypothetical protein
MKSDLFGQRMRSDPAQTERVRGWVTAALHLGPDTPMLITELRCSEPGCPPVETVIAVLDQPGQPRQFKIHKPLAEVSEADVDALAAAASTAEPHHADTAAQEGQLPQSVAIRDQAPDTSA